MTSNPMWETRKFPKKPRKVKKLYEPEKDLCRVIPIRLAQIPNIADWLLKQRKSTVSAHINIALDAAYREIGELIKESKN